MTDKQTPPTGYSKLPEGTRCRCVKLWEGADGFYCCKPRASEMTDKQTPPDWVLIEAAKRSNWDDARPGDRRIEYRGNPMFRALCDMIERYEARPVDRKLLCAREAAAHLYSGEPEEAGFKLGYRDERDQVVVALRAIELWEEGFGK